jgi:hypothetical protein
MLLLNGGGETVWFTLPGPPWATKYMPIIDTNNIVAGTNSDATTCDLQDGEAIQLAAQSMIALRGI